MQAIRPARCARAGCDGVLLALPMRASSLYRYGEGPSSADPGRIWRAAEGD